MRFVFLLLIQCACIASSFADSVLNKDEATAHQLLVGFWHHTVLIRKIGDQELVPQKAQDDSYIEFKADGTWSMSTPYYKSAGTYKWLGPDVLETSYLYSDLLIQIGMVTVAQIRVDDKRLNIIRVQTAEELAKYTRPPKSGSPPFPDVMLTSVFSRIAIHK